MWTTYQKAKSKIKHGDVFFTASPALFSRLIRWFTKSKVSHCGIFVKIGRRMFAVESIEGSGVIMSLASTRFDNEKIVIGRPNRVPSDLLDSILKDVQATGYDLAGAVLAPFFDTKTARAFCSEWVARKLKLNFEHFTNGVTPKDILTALSDQLVGVPYKRFR